MQSGIERKEYVISKENVLGLDITMNHVHLVTVIDCRCNSTDIGSRSSLTETLSLQQVFVDFSFWRVFQNHIYTLLVPEIAVHAEDVLVFEMGLNFDFTLNLLLDSTPLQFTLLNDLDCHNELGFDLTGEIHTTY